MHSLKLVYSDMKTDSLRQNYLMLLQQARGQQTAHLSCSLKEVASYTYVLHRVRQLSSIKVEYICINNLHVANNKIQAKNKLQSVSPK